MNTGGVRVHLASSSELHVAAKDRKKRQQSGPLLCWPASLKPHEIRPCQPTPPRQARAASAGLSGIMIEGPWQRAMENGASIPSPSHGWEAPAVPTHSVLRHRSEAGLHHSEHAQRSMCLGDRQENALVDGLLCNKPQSYPGSALRSPGQQAAPCCLLLLATSRLLPFSHPLA